MTSSLGSLVGQTLTWVPTPALKYRYDLIAPDKTPLATLDMGNLKNVKAVVPEGTLFIHQEGFLGSKIVISSGEHGPLLATYRSEESEYHHGGHLVFPDGRKFRWDPQKAWTDPTGHTTYVHFSGGGFSRTSTAVIHPQAAEIPDLSVLLVLGLYQKTIFWRNILRWWR
jgi:hypothetical protein